MKGESSKAFVLSENTVCVSIEREQQKRLFSLFCVLRNIFINVPLIADDSEDSLLSLS